MGITVNDDNYLPVGVDYDPILVMAAIANAILSITGDEIPDGTIVNDHIATNTIVANEKIFALSIQAGQMETDSVIARIIQANAVTADKISVTDLAAVSTSTGTLTINTNGYIVSDPFTSGALGQGFKIWDTGLAEFNNVRVRGKITSSVFEKSAVSSIGGNFLVSDSDILDADMTALDASTLTVSGDTTFSVGDFLRIKDGTDDEWLEVTNVGSAPEYTVTRDKAGDYTADTNPIWKSGTAVVNYGASGEGLIYMTASDTNAPYLDVLTHAGAPWTTTTTEMRMGNLNGYLGYATDKYGIAIGESTKYLKYDSTNGLQVKGNIDADTGNLGTLSVTNSITVSSQGSISSNATSSYPYLQFSNAGLQLKDSDTGGTYSTAVYSTDKYGYGASVWILNSDLKIPWLELKEPNAGASDVASMRLYNRGDDPGGAAEIGDLAVVSGKLKICTGAGTPGTWTTVGTQT